MEEPKEQQLDSNKIKEIDGAFLAIKFYPVAVKLTSKEEAYKKLEKLYKKESEPLKQMILYLAHEYISSVSELRAVHNFDYFKLKNPTLDQTQLKMSVYRAMFNSNSSIEGIIEMISFLGSLNTDDAAKVLTHNFSHFCSSESETTHILRSAILDSLGKSNSIHALSSLLLYARYGDSERTFQRVVNALFIWSEKLDKLNVPKNLRTQIDEFLTKELEGKHYG